LLDARMVLHKGGASCRGAFVNGAGGLGAICWGRRLAPIRGVSRRLGMKAEVR